MNFNIGKKVAESMLNSRMLFPPTVRSRMVVTAVAAFLACGVSAQVLDSTISMQNSSNNQAAKSQGTIDNLADQTDDILNDFRQVVSETESLKIYNAQLRRLVENQRSELTSIDKQLGELEETDRAVTPLMIDMTGTLAEIVERDVPFRLEERRNKAADLTALLDDPNVTVSEKFRQILAMYQAEINFGRTTFADQGDLPSGETVEFLRIGRTLLFYQSLDGETTGWWSPITREFEALGSEYRLAVKDGIAIAQSRRAPDLVRLPVPAPVDAK
jgi:TolA-binding protein